jgi:hypothetical protein
VPSACFFGELAFVIDEKIKKILSFHKIKKSPGIIPGDPLIKL